MIWPRAVEPGTGVHGSLRCRVTDRFRSVSICLRRANDSSAVAVGLWRRAPLNCGADTGKRTTHRASLARRSAQLRPSALRRRPEYAATPGYGVNAVKIWWRTAAASKAFSARRRAIPEKGTREAVAARIAAAVLRVVDYRGSAGTCPHAPPYLVPVKAHHSTGMQTNNTQLTVCGARSHHKPQTCLAAKGPGEFGARSKRTGNVGDRRRLARGWIVRLSAIASFLLRRYTGRYSQ
jgi:hypothetical protein